MKLKWTNSNYTIIDPEPLMLYIHEPQLRELGFEEEVNIEEIMLCALEQGFEIGFDFHGRITYLK